MYVDNIWKIYPHCDMGLLTNKVELKDELIKSRLKLQIHNAQYIDDKFNVQSLQF